MKTESRRLRELPISFIDGDRSSKYPKRDEFTREGVLFLNTTNIVDDMVALDEANYVSFEKFAQISKGRVERHDILITTRGSIGKVALYRLADAALINAQMLIVRTDQRQIDPRFLFHTFRAPGFQESLRNFASGSAQPQIPVKDLKEIEVRLPALPIQHRIASILSAYDDLIENNTKRIKVLEEMARSLYREWFVHYRFPGHEKVKLVDSALGKVPEGWEIARIEQLYQTASGGTPSRKREDYFLPGGKGIPWVKTKELLNGWLISTEESISEAGLNSSSAKVFPANTLLVAMYGATIGQLGLLGIPCATNQACCAILPQDNPSAFGPYFAWCYFIENQKKIAALGLGAAQPNISQVVIRGLQLPRPPNDLVRRFERFSTPIFAQLLNLHTRNTTLRRTRDMLLPKLISGEIEVDAAGPG